MLKNTIAKNAPKKTGALSKAFGKDQDRTDRTMVNTIIGVRRDFTIDVVDAKGRTINKRPILYAGKVEDKRKFVRQTIDETTNKVLEMFEEEVFKMD